MDFESISLAARTQCHANPDGARILAAVVAAENIAWTVT